MNFTKKMTKAYEKLFQFTFFFISLNKYQIANLIVLVLLYLRIDLEPFKYRFNLTKIERCVHKYCLQFLRRVNIHVLELNQVIIASGLDHDKNIDLEV